jgi:hypothetical protein
MGTGPDFLRGPPGLLRAGPQGWSLFPERPKQDPFPNPKQTASGCVRVSTIHMVEHWPLDLKVSLRLRLSWVLSHRTSFEELRTQLTAKL